MLLLSQLAPYLRAQVEQAQAELPSLMSWPTTGYAVFTDCSDGSVGYHAGVLAIDGVSHTVIADNPGRLDPSKVDVSWSIEINEGTGVVRALPTFSGIRAQGGLPNQLDLLCRAAGFHARALADFGRLVRLTPSSKEFDAAAVRLVGIDPAVLTFHVKAIDLPRIKANLRQAFALG